MEIRIEDLSAEQRKAIASLKNLSCEGVAPSTAGGPGGTLQSRLFRLGLPWTKACELAGVLSRRQASRLGARPKEGSWLRSFFEEEEKRKALERAENDHRCLTCVWSRRVDSRVIFCPLPPGYCIAKREPGTKNYGTFCDKADDAVSISRLEERE